MSLKNILLDVSSVLGLDISDEDEKQYHITKINEAALELYRSNDIPGCLREQLFQLNDTNTYQIAIPWYVEKIRAIRFYNTNGGQINLEDMRPRYHTHRWGSNNRLRFRIKQLNALLSQGINNAGLFTFTLSKAELVDVVLNIIGKTTTADRAVETLTIPAGQLVVTTANSYEEFYAIEKTALNNYNITITDVDNQEMGIIPNNLIRPQYTIIQIREDDFSPLTNNSFPLNTVEMLYKTRFVAFENLYDEFPCPDCDKLIFWQFLIHFAIYKPETGPLAAGAAQMLTKNLNELCVNDTLGQDIKVQWAPNTMFDAQRNVLADFYYSAPVPLIEYTSP